MKRIVVDTNVLVSFLTDRDLDQQERAGRLFAAAADGRAELILHQAVLTEMVYVLKNLYLVASDEIASTLADLLALPGISVVDEVAWTRLFELWPTKFRDFADALLALVAKTGGHDGIATFDRRFVRELTTAKIEILGLE